MSIEHIIGTLFENTSWEGFPLRSDIGQQPTEKDTPPKRTPEGDFILYHGTSRDAAKKIIDTRTLLADDIGCVGVGTIPDAVSTFAAHKQEAGGAVILQIVVDKDWMAKQQIRHEGGGHHSAFLIYGERPKVKMAKIPSEVIKKIQIIGESMDNFESLVDRLSEPSDMFHEQEAEIVSLTEDKDGVVEGKGFLEDKVELLQKKMEELNKFAKGLRKGPDQSRVYQQIDAVEAELTQARIALEKEE